MVDTTSSRGKGISEFGDSLVYSSRTSGTNRETLSLEEDRKLCSCASLTNAEIRNEEYQSALGLQSGAS